MIKLWKVCKLFTSSLTEKVPCTYHSEEPVVEKGFHAVSGWFITNYELSEERKRRSIWPQIENHTPFNVQVSVLNGEEGALTITVTCPEFETYEEKLLRERKAK